MNARLTKNQFIALIHALFSAYKSFLQKASRTLKGDDDDLISIQKILSTEELLNLPHGYNKIVFGDGIKKSSFKYSLENSIRAVVSESIDSKDIGNVIYKKCIAYKKGSNTFNIPWWMFTFCGFEGFEDFEKMLNSQKVHRSATMETGVKKIPEQIRENLIGCWELYFYNNENLRGRHTVARALLDVKDLEDITLINKADLSSLDYQGGVNWGIPYVQDIVNLILKPIDQRKETNLQIILKVNEYKFDLCVAHYTNISQRGNVISGSMILRKRLDLNDKDKQNIPTTFYFDQTIPDIDQDLGRYIIAFFRDKHLNFQKLPHTIFSDTQFSNWSKKQQYLKEMENLRAEEPPSDYRLFISHPYSSIKNDEYRKLSTEMLMEAERIKHTLKQVGFKEVYTVEEVADEELKAKPGSINNPQVHFNDLRKKYDLCSHHLVIWPDIDFGQSAALIEIGWSIITKKPMTIFRVTSGLKGDKDLKSEELSYFPSLLDGAIKKANSGIHYYKVDAFDQILNMLREERDEIFPFSKNFIWPKVEKTKYRKI